MVDVVTGRAGGLTAENVTVALGGRTVLSGVSLEINPGELVAVLGPNGAGKSTFLNLLSGEQEVQDGNVAIAGEPMTDMSVKSLARKRALMPQKASLAFPFKVRDVVEMGRDPFRKEMTTQENDTAIDWALSEADIGYLADRVYTRLSGGEQQRVQLARVLAQVWRPADCDEPRYLLLDEPTSSLDLAHQHSVLHVARGLTDQKAGVVAVVHDLNLAALYATRVAVLDQGRLVATGHPDDVLEEDLIARVFDLSVHTVMDPASGRKLLVPNGYHKRRSNIIEIRKAL